MQNNKLFCILGKSGASKTSIAEFVSEYTNTSYYIKL